MLRNPGRPSLRAVFLVTALTAGCASVQPQIPPAAQASAQPDVRVEPVMTLAARSEPPSRREIVRQLLRHSVRIFIYDGEKNRRTASGVVVGSRSRDGRVTAYVLTNAHVLDTAGYGAPRFSVRVDRRAESTDYPAAPLALGKVPDMDLGLLAVEGLELPPASLAADDELELGEDVIVAAAPYGRPISLSGGMISHLDWDAASDAPKMLKTDAPIGYGASGGGIFSLTTGRLVALVEGYRTAKISFDVERERYSFDVPMPGETFAAPSAKIRRFLGESGFSWLLEAPPASPRLATEG